MCETVNIWQLIVRVWEDKTKKKRQWVCSPHSRCSMCTVLHRKGTAISHRNPRLSAVCKWPLNNYSVQLLTEMDQQSEYIKIISKSY